MLSRTLKSLTRRSLAAFGYRLKRMPDPSKISVPPVYNSDSLTVYDKNLPFLTDPRFMSAYRRGITSGQVFGGAANQDIHIEYRVAVTVWAAAHGAKLAGDFVECGVNTGIYSLAICEYLDFNKLDKSFYLFDTYAGIPDEQMTDSERPKREAHRSHYPDCYELVKQNFAPFPRAIPVRGKVPDTLTTVKIDRVAYLSIDMNITLPERAAIEYFWPKLTPGALVVLDDYAWRGYEEQKDSMDAFARSVGVEILALPTGQGLIIKP
ncbi:MAG TPA: TylF/MycF/NovP-related O-methyltransferase [Kofleriaceae bacterium]